MSREKQIEEMARAMCPFSKNTLCRECSDECFYKDYAERAYNAGYRKQSEGEWIKVAAYNDGILNTVKCSVCNTFMPIVGWDWSCLPYCPFCGAKMKGGAE